MPAPYDKYNYPAYWEGREYEHHSEIIAIKAFLDRIKEISNILEIGAGFGRLTPSYLYRGKKITLLDSSAKLLSLARARLPENKVKVVHSRLETIPEKINRKSVDLVILVRVLHHIDDIDKCFSIISNVLKNNKYFILEFANKSHKKATALEFLRGNLTFLHDIFPKEVSSKKSRGTSLPFRNYHPDVIKEQLKKNGFRIIEIRSVSNIRSPRLKTIIPTETLLYFERLLQKPFSKINFGPSLFILAQKVGQSK